MKAENISLKARVRVASLQSTSGMLVNPQHLVVRQEGTVGTIFGVVPGHGGDVWWVQHDELPDIGAYCFTELELLEDQTPAEEPLGSPRAPKIGD